MGVMASFPARATNIVLLLGFSKGKPSVVARTSHNFSTANTDHLHVLVLFSTLSFNVVVLF